MFFLAGQILTRYLLVSSVLDQGPDLEGVRNLLKRVVNSLYEKEYGIGHLDDGLIYIGTNFCYNHENPKCIECPIRELCLANKKRDLIYNYRT